MRSSWPGTMRWTSWVSCTTTSTHCPSAKPSSGGSTTSASSPGLRQAAGGPSRRCETPRAAWPRPRPTWQRHFAGIGGRSLQPGRPMGSCWPAGSPRSPAWRGRYVATVAVGLG
eukprot:745629-Lingulodinium_polyedra.AAC.1